MQTFLVTGAAGCLGAWTVRTLVRAGRVVVALDQDYSAGRMELVMTPADLAPVRRVVADIAAQDQIRQAVLDSEATHVIHLAGLLAPACRADPVHGAQINLLGTVNLFEAAREAAVERFVYASSVAAYGPIEDERPVTEGAACRPSTLYGVYKRSIEEVARIYAEDFGLSSVGLRPSIIYGLGRDTGLTSDITEAIRSAVLGRPFHIRFEGRTEISLAADVAATMMACADYATAGAHVFNVHGCSVDVGELVAMIDDALLPQSRGLITHGGMRLADVECMDDSALRSAVGALAVTPLNDGIRQTVAAFRRLYDGGKPVASTL